MFIRDSLIKKIVEDVILKIILTELRVFFSLNGVIFQNSLVQKYWPNVHI